MCRWMAYCGGIMNLYDLLYNHKHSIVIQSLDSTEGAEATNGDGFGVGWYPENSKPILFKSVEPAWHDRNLKEISKAIEARVVLAHVRAASPMVGNVQQTNCHPFRHENWLWMHNGVIRGFKEIKRDILLRIDEELFPCIEGGTDSEAFFYLALSFGLRDDPPKAVAKAVGYIIKMAKKRGVQRPPIQMTVCTTDGNRIWAFRYSSEGSSGTGESRTLYYSSSKEDLVKLYEGNDEVLARLSKYDDESRFVVSEPLGSLPGAWNKVPESTYVYMEGKTLTLSDFEPIDAE